MEESLPGGRRAWAIFGVMGAVYCLSMFYRVSTAIIAVDLAREFSIGPEELSLLGGVFFYFFAFSQLPLGPALDRFGARRMILLGTLLGAAGAFLFAVGNSFALMLCARALMGMGMAPILMGSLKLFSQWFPAGYFGVISGLIMGVGSLGSLIASSPLAWLVAAVGWRSSFALFGAATLLGTLLVAAVVRDGEMSGQNGAIGVREGVRRILAARNLWFIAPLAMVSYASLISLQGLWAGPFFMESCGFTRGETGEILFSLGLTGAVGTVAAGYVSDRLVRGRKTVVVAGTAATILFMLPLIGIFAPSGVAGWVAVFGGIGFFSSARGLIYAHAKESVPPELSGTALTAINFFIMLGPALMHQSMGFVLHRHPGLYPAAFAIPLAALAVGTVIYLATKDTFIDGNRG